MIQGNPEPPFEKKILRQKKVSYDNFGKALLDSRI